MAGMVWERKFEVVLLQEDWQKVPGLECLHVRSKLGFFLSVFVDDVKMVGERDNLSNMCARLK